MKKLDNLPPQYKTQIYDNTPSNFKQYAYILNDR
jgi:hypothetical protein